MKVTANTVTSKKTVTVGEKKQIAVYTYDNLTLKNTDESVVDAYLQATSNASTLYLTGKKRGISTVTIGKFNNSYNRWDYDVYDVTVVDVINILIPEALSVFIGDTYTFSPSITDSQATTTLTWYSSNTSVATIDQDGVLTAKSAGTSTITCTATNGVSAQCVVTVNPVLATSITLNKSSMSIQQGNTATLTATIKPSNVTNGTVKWKTNNSNIATVNQSGVVTAVKTGSATITASTTDGSNLSATCIVTVTPILATSITLNKSSVSMKVSKTYQLTATVLPENAANKEVTWKSSNSQVVTVDETGLLTAIKEGTATITATTADGSNLSATCEITVNPILATSISLDKTELKLPIGKSATLNATIKPTNATYKTVEWKSSNNKVATVSADGLVTAIKTGTATITATTTDGTDLSATCNVTVQNFALILVDASVNTGSQAKMMVKMRNEENVAGLQCDIVLPDGIEMVGATLSTNRAPKHTIGYNKMSDSDNTYRVVILSTSGDVIDNASGGTVFSVTLKPDAELMNVSLPVKICNAILTTEDGVKIYPADAEATFSVVGPAKGDVNNDGSVDLADAVGIVNHVLGKYNQTFVVDVADVDNDGEVDIADAVRIVNFVVGKISALARDLEWNLPEPQ